MQSIIQTIIYSLAIFIPLTFTTINSELFEFPKFILLLSGSLVILSAWIYDIIINKKETPQLKIVNWNLITYGVLAILITQTLATIFSINPYTSFWGYYSRYHQGLLTTICYTILYFAASFYLDKKSVHKLIKISVGTSFVISLYAIAQRLGIDKSLWIQDVVNRPFSTLGQPNWLAAYLLPNLFLALYLHNISPKSSTFIRYTLFTILFVALLFTKSRSGFVAFGLSYLVYWILLAHQLSFPKIKANLFRNSLFVILFALLVGTPYTPSISALIQWQPAAHQPETAVSVGTQLENGGTESGDIRKIVWTGALELIKKYPLLGTGPETFAYTYYWERPITHNDTSEWDFLYNKAHNEYLNLAATTGLVGLLAYLSFHFAVLKTSLTTIPKSKKINQIEDDHNRALYPVLGAALTSFAITNFFGFSVIPVYYLMILIAALPLALKNPPQPNTHDSLPITHYLIFIPLLYPLHLFLGDVNYAKGKAYLDANQPGLALTHLQKASDSRPGLDLYQSALGEAYAQLGQVELALRSADLTRRLNPYHLNYHKSRAKIYLTLASTDPQYNQLAATELEDARSLAPTDPKLAYNLALVYTRLGKNNEAKEQLQQAIALKPNYESPYYALTLLYEQTNQKDLIPDLLLSAETHLATYSSALREKIVQYQN